MEPYHGGNQAYVFKTNEDRQGFIKDCKKECGDLFEYMCAEYPGKLEFIK